MCQEAEVELLQGDGKPQELLSVNLSRLSFKDSVNSRNKAAERCPESAAQSIPAGLKDNVVMKQTAPCSAGKTSLCSEVPTGQWSCQTPPPCCRPGNDSC